MDLDIFREEHENEKREAMSVKQMFTNMKNKYSPIILEVIDKEQEITNLNIRREAQEAEKQNLQKEKESIQREKEKIQKEYEAYRTIQEKKFTNRVKRKVKGIIRRK